MRLAIGEQGSGLTEKERVSRTNNNIRKEWGKSVVRCLVPKNKATLRRWSAPSSPGSTPEGGFLNAALRAIEASYVPDAPLLTRQEPALSIPTVSVESGVDPTLGVLAQHTEEGITWTDYLTID